MSGKIIVLGLTGGIGGGKSLVASHLEKYGAKVIYADQIARQIIDTNKLIKKKIIRAFGKEAYLPNGHLDRRRVADLIFKYPELKSVLNKIVHPPTIKVIDEIIKKLRNKQKTRLIVVEAALIFEAGVERKFDYILVVNAPINIRISRLMKRDKISREKIRNRIKSQISNRKKITRADFIINNTGTKKDLEKISKFLYNLLTQPA